MLVDCKCDMRKLTLEEVQAEVKGIVDSTERLILSLQNRLHEGGVCSDHFILIMINSIGILSAALVKSMCEGYKNREHENIIPLLNNITQRCGVELRIDSIESIQATQH